MFSVQKSEKTVNSVMLPAKTMTGTFLVAIGIIMALAGVLSIFSHRGYLPHFNVIPQPYPYVLIGIGSFISLLGIGVLITNYYSTFRKKSLLQHFFSTDKDLLTKGVSLPWLAKGQGVAPVLNEQESLKAASLFIQRGDDINEIYAQHTPLQAAIRQRLLPLANFLLSQPDVDLSPAETDDRDTALHLALKCFSHDPEEYTKIIKRLVEKEAPLDFANKLGELPFHLALRTGNKELITYFISIYPTNPINNIFSYVISVFPDGETLINTMDLLVEKGFSFTLNASEKFLLHQALSTNKPLLALHLLNTYPHCFSTWNQLDDQEKTPLHYAVSTIRSQTHAYELIKKLIACGADPNEPLCGIPPFYEAFLYRWEIFKKYEQKDAALLEHIEEECISISVFLIINGAQPFKGPIIKKELEHYHKADPTTKSLRWDAYCAWFEAILSQNGQT